LGKTNREGCHGKTLKNRAPPLLLGAAVREPRRRHQPPPQQRQKRSKPPPLCQVTILYPHSCFFFPFLHAERIAFCMQGWGENNPPRPFWLLGQADPGPALPSGPVLVQKGILDFWAKVGPIHFGPRSAQHLWGCVRPSWLQNKEVLITHLRVDDRRDVTHPLQNNQSTGEFHTSQFGPTTLLEHARICPRHSLDSR